jgi:hypothetical protein
MAAFHGVSPELFPGGPPFIGGSDQGVFYGSDTSFTAGAKNQGYTWTPADASLRTKAGNKWAELSSPDISDADLAFKGAMTRKFDTLLQSFYGAVGSHSTLGYSPDATQQVVYVGDQLKKAMRELVAYRLKPDVLTTTPVTERSADPASTSAGTVNRGAVNFPSTTSGAMTGTPAPDNTKMYLIVGVGALVLLVGGALLLRRKPAATAGYRRRRRR